MHTTLASGTWVIEVAVSGCLVYCADGSQTRKEQLIGQVQLLVGVDSSWTT